MTLAEFKSSFGLQTLNLYKSKTSSRLVGRFYHNGKEQSVVTTEQFSAQSAVYVYPTEITDTDTGEVNTIYVLSNKSATPAVTL